MALRLTERICLTEFTLSETEGLRKHWERYPSFLQNLRDRDVRVKAGLVRFGLPHVSEVGGEEMTKATLWRLLLMGAISGTVGWVVRCLPGLLALPPSHTATPRQWLLFIAVPCAVGMGIAVLFPLWQRRIAIRSMLLQCIVFWFVVPVVLLTAYTSVLSGFSWLTHLRLSIPLLFLFVGTLVAGICFYGMGKLLEYTPESSTGRL